jgi:hypothetical protein
MSSEEKIKQLELKVSELTKKIHDLETRVNNELTKITRSLINNTDAVTDMNINLGESNSIIIERIKRLQGGN